jgi:hypothetical protein
LSAEENTERSTSNAERRIRDSPARPIIHTS